MVSAATAGMAAAAAVVMVSAVTVFDVLMDAPMSRCL